MKWFQKTFINLCITRLKLIIWALCDEHNPNCPSPDQQSKRQDCAKTLGDKKKPAINLSKQYPYCQPPPCCGKLPPCCEKLPPCCEKPPPCCEKPPPCCEKPSPCSEKPPPCCCKPPPCCCKSLPCCGKPPLYCGKQPPCCCKPQCCFRPPSWINRDEAAIRRCVCRPPARPIKRLDDASWKWINPAKKYKNPVLTSTGGLPIWLPLLFGLAGGFGVVTLLNWTKPKTRKYICYHPPPPYLEHEPPPNCCRPTIIEIDESGKPVNDKPENQIKDCYRIKIIDPCNIHDHDPCASIKCDKKD